MKNIIRDLFGPLLYKFYKNNRIFQIQNGKYIICYHGVTKLPNFNINNRHLHQKQFESDLIHFSRNFKLASINELFSTDTISEKPLLAITFDDGYLNNFTNVLTLVSEYKRPVCFFIITKGLENSNYITWYDLLDFIKLDLPEEIKFNNLSFKLNSNSKYKNENVFIEDYIKNMGNEREVALEKLYLDYKMVIDNYKLKFPDYWKLVNKEILQNHVSNPYLTIGSHTHSHFNLSNIDLKLVETEFKVSKSILEKICGYEVSTLAYPDGSYSEDVKQMALNCGYTKQFAVEYMLESDLTDNYIANRYSYSNSTTHEVNLLKLAYNAKRYNLRKL